MSEFPSLAEIQTAREVLKDLIRMTPCVEVRPGELNSDPSFGSTLIFKLELFQIRGTFKPRGALCVMLDLAAGHPVSLSSVSTIADSLAPPMATPYTFEVCRKFVDRITLIDDDSLRNTMAIAFRDLKLCVEPAGAAALAAASGPLRAELQGGQRVGIVVCGSNIDYATFHSQAGPRAVAAPDA